MREATTANDSIRPTCRIAQAVQDRRDDFFAHGIFFELWIIEKGKVEIVKHGDLSGITSVITESGR